jgi:hypothetical protein
MRVLAGENDKGGGSGGDDVDSVCEDDVCVGLSFIAILALDLVPSGYSSPITK